MNIIYKIKTISVNQHNICVEKNKRWWEFWKQSETALYAVDLKHLSWKWCVKVCQLTNRSNRSLSKCWLRLIQSDGFTFWAEHMWLMSQAHAGRSHSESHLSHYHASLTLKWRLVTHLSRLQLTDSPVDPENNVQAHKAELCNYSALHLFERV